MKLGLSARTWALVALTFAGCTHGRTDTDVGDASAPASGPRSLPGPVPMPTPSAGGFVHRHFRDGSEEHATLIAARALVAKHPVFGRLMEPTERGLSLEPEGFVTEAWRTPNAHRQDLIGSVLPHRASDFWRVSPGRIERWAMSLQPIGVSDVVGRLDAGRVIYPDALPHADVIAVARDREVEQFVLLKDRAAPSELRWRVHLGSDLKPRMRGNGALDFLDGSGEAALRVQRPLAIDAKGETVEATLSLEGDQLVVRVATATLTYPVLLDPVIEVPVWQNVTPSPPVIPGAVGLTLTYSRDSGGALMIGGTTASFGSFGGIFGSCPGSYSSVYKWDGAWTSLATPAGVWQRWQHATSTYGNGLIVFGGQNCSGGGGGPALKDTWTLSGSTWTQVCASCLPPGEMSSQMAYLSGTGAVMFNGNDSSAAAYVYNGGSDWTKVAYGGADTANGMVPSPREAGSMSADPVTGTVLMLGGFNVPVSGGAVPWSDAWQYHPTATGATYGSFHWTPICGAGALTGCPFAPRAHAGFVYDSARKKHVLFGGESNKSYIGVSGFQDTWEYDSATGTWLQLCATCSPVRWWAPLAYDPVRGRVITAASFDYSAGSRQTETWELHVRGGSCASDTDCDTGHCVEGTCCESVCPTCQTCVAASSPGVCSNVLPGVSDPLGRCSGGGQCNGGGACGSPLGVSCAAGSDCATGNCTDGVCCKTGPCSTGFTCAPSGTCKKSIGQLCSTLSECATGNCVDGTCCSSASCAANHHCNYASNAGTCLSDNGRTCVSSAECGSGNCVDGYCCNSSCSGQCQACDVGGSAGTCIPVSGSPHTATGARSACAGSGSCGSVCNGSDATACHYPGASISCGSASCSSGTATQVGVCNGGGSCNQPSTSCGAYACSGTICKTTCSADTDCANTTSYFCNAGTCTSPKLANGKSCSGANACASGNCVGSTCCDSPCTGAGYSCNVSGAVGHCAKANGTSCGVGTECATGNCVDGVCCNSACTGQCQACDVTGNVGTCVAVTGAAHTTSGLRLACSGSGTCGSFCNGSNPTACTAPGASTACGSASCASTAQTNVGQCNGAGACMQTTTPCGNYACGTTSCKTSCTLDTDCASTSYYCSGGSCQLKLGNGSTCASATSCQSGNCVSGICCNTACTGAGFSCNLSGSPGKCSKANGTACGAGPECGSGFCVDGVCCDSACGGQCQACDVSGRTGTCSAVIGGPHGARSACSGTGVGSACGPSCDGKNLVACTYPAGTTTCGAATCSDGSSLSTYSQVGSCNGSGSCTAGSGDCGTFRCSGVACGTACSAKSQCSAGNYCDTAHNTCVPIVGLGNSCTDPTACPSGFCVDGVCCEAACGPGLSCNGSPTTKGHCRKLLGVACITGGECASGNCVDGNCCSSRCTGSCEACDVSGKEGTCTPIVGQPKIGHPACSGSPTDPACGLSCNGTDSLACHFSTMTSSCGTASCDKGIEQDVSTCDGSGACKPSTRSCGLYNCGATACLSTCSTDGDCSAGNFCKAGACVGTQSLGEGCSGDTQCKSGHCTDGVCCGVATCPTGAACAGPGASAGTCLKGNGTACMAGAECASSHCVDGVCCDKGCDGQCEACDLGGSPGTCTPVTDVPHGMRMACDALDAKDCAKASCDGATRDKCVGFKNGATTSCGKDVCTSDKKQVQKHGQCDGKGGCALAAPVSCLEYTCDSASGACKSTCTADADCADTFKCDPSSSRCVQGSTCSADRTQSTDKSGKVSTCTPYLCGPDGNCGKECATSADCVPGTACDTAIHACIEASVAAADASSSGGCAVSGAPSDTKSSCLLASLGLALALAGRRSRKRAR